MREHLTSSSYITVLKWRRCCQYLQCSHTVMCYCFLRPMREHLTSSSYITVLKWRRCCQYLQCSLHAVGSLASVDRSHPKHTLSLLSEIENKQTKTCLQKQLVNIITFNQDRLINTNNLYTFCLQKGFCCLSIGICLYAVWRGDSLRASSPIWAS